MKLVQSSLNVRKDLESSFHHCGGPMKLIHTSLRVKDLHMYSGENCFLDLSHHFKRHAQASQAFHNCEKWLLDLF